LNDYAVIKPKCQENNGGCSKDAKCTDTPGGGVTCVCNAGFTGDGFNCPGKSHQFYKVTKVLEGKYMT